ncbi:hypothetical protein [Halomarina rubra]|uniref:Uncharacterized protein n=1 Tax=Halomarina rubra TaxID=2071873 RepID=A0ABD6ATB6_9EURY|nr:hypothetical protein [Halomarina rubra]
MQRRRYLALCGTAAAGLLAGCNEGPGGNSDSANQQGTVEGPAQFNNVLINAPQQAAIGSEVEMTITARNFGGETGSYTDRIVTVDGDTDFAQDVSIGDVPAGQTGETTVKAKVNSAGDYRFKLEEAEVFTTVQVTAEAVELGKMVDVGNNLQLTFTDASFQNGVYYRYVDNVGYTTDMFTGQQGNKYILGVFRAKMKNAGSQETLILPDQFKIDGGTVHATIDGKPLTTVEGLDGKPLLGSPIKSGETIDGWVLASIPVENVNKNGVDIGWALNKNSDSPDRLWSFPPRALPDWQQLEFRLSEKSSDGMLSGEVTIRNQGQVEGTFYGLAEFHYKGIGWEPGAYPTGTIAPGATKTFSFEYAWPYVQQTEWRVQPFEGKRQIVEGGPQSLSYGDQTLGIDGSQIRLSNPRLMNSYGYTATDSSNSGTSQQVTKRREAGQGKRFLFVDVEATVGTEGGQVPMPSTFVAEAGGSTAKPFTGPTPTDPDVSFYSGANGGKKGDKSKGTLVFVVPASASNPTVTYKEDFNLRTTEISWQ